MVAVKRTASLRYVGSASLRYRLVLAILTGRTVRFDEIRSNEQDAPGLSPAEVSFVRLLDKITNGSAIDINETGTTLRFRPGILVGQAAGRMSHECHPSRPVAYYLEPLLMLAPFCKKALDITLKGPTHGPTDQSADFLAQVTIPLLRHITYANNIDPQLTVVRRALASSHENYGGGRGGLVIFRCGILSSKVAPVELVDHGFVKRVRGLALANRVSTSCITQMIDAARKCLNRFTSDVYIHTDHGNGAECGAGFGMGLVAETTEGCLLGADWSCVDSSQSPTQVARSSVNMLLEQISQGGCIDYTNIPLALLYCALADSDISRIRVGRLSEGHVLFLRDLKKFFGVVFRLKSTNLSEELSDCESHSSSDDAIEPLGICSQSLIMSCVGIGLDNAARQRF